MLEIFRLQQEVEAKAKAKRKERRDKRLQFEVQNIKAQNVNMMSMMSVIANTQAETVNQNIQSNTKEEAKTSNKTLFMKLRISQRTALIRGSASSPSHEPTKICSTCERLFEATTSHAGFL